MHVNGNAGRDGAGGCTAARRGWKDSLDVEYASAFFSDDQNIHLLLFFFLRFYFKQ